MRFATAFLRFAGLCVLASCAGRPHWTGVTPEGYENRYAVGLGRSATSAAEAREHAVTDGLGKLVMERGVTVSLADSTRRESRETVDSLVMRTSTVRDIVTRGQATEFRGLSEVASYVESGPGSIQAWSLIRVPRLPADVRHPPGNARATLLSMVAPGAGQVMVKQDRNKGLALLGTTAALVAGTLFCNSQYNSHLADIRPTNSQAQNDFHQNRANQFNGCRWGLSIGAAAAWGYAVIDAAAARPRYWR